MPPRRVIELFAMKTLVKISKLTIHTSLIILIAINFYWAIDGTVFSDPVEHLLHLTGLSSLKLLIITLTITPIVKFGHAPIFMQFRRLLGVWSCIFALLHFLVFVAFEIQFDWALVLEELVSRPFISVGFVALVILIALAVTSFHAVRRRMGRQWQRLHNWVYLCLPLTILHYLWSLKSVGIQASVFLILAVILLGLRKKTLMRPLNKVK
ncbi:sulfoxide reductase heme-binding subunit YedZ [Aestuariibacter sp. AA17]|uniref:Protein-methionine-sulfoxide reductase heme-binding subunit MsrQ n=2 Tax=Fluctibacter corallii TaxID=2984329 RepID=A0ABT3A6Z0_9ALTE|nr:sulfoxide reductase heme-binding subunit YedZ [Aestuariibacter sp. AA17]